MFRGVNEQCGELNCFTSVFTWYQQYNSVSRSISRANAFQFPSKTGSVWKKAHDLSSQKDAKVGEFYLTGKKGKSYIKESFRIFPGQSSPFFNLLLFCSFIHVLVGCLSFFLLALRSSLSAFSFDLFPEGYKICGPMFLGGNRRFLWHRRSHPAEWPVFWTSHSCWANTTSVCAFFFFFFIFFF